MTIVGAVMTALNVAREKEQGTIEQLNVTPITRGQFVALFVLVIYLFLSGLFTPVESMPAWAEVLADLNPVKHFVALMRAALITGARVAQVATELLALVAFAAVALPLAVVRYSKTAA